jgi:hypothetical protein
VVSRNVTVFKHPYAFWSLSATLAACAYSPPWSRRSRTSPLALTLIRLESVPTPEPRHRRSAHGRK